MTCKRQPYVYQAFSLPNVFFSWEKKNTSFLNLKETALKNLSFKIFEQFQVRSDLFSPRISFFQREARSIFPVCVPLSEHNIQGNGMIWEKEIKDGTLESAFRL